MLNSIILLGRLTKDPELRKSNSDVSITNFTLAFDNPNVDVSGERGTTFIDVRCFGQVADSVVKHVRKGSKVAITGQFTSRSYLNKAGEKRTAYEIQANSVEFLDPKPVNEEQEEEETEVEIAVEEAKFDPYTGKPLNKKSKK